MNVKQLYNELKFGKKKKKILLVKGNKYMAVIFHGTTMPFVLPDWCLDGNLALLTSEYSEDGKLDYISGLGTRNTPNGLEELIADAVSRVSVLEQNDLDNISEEEYNEENPIKINISLAYLDEVVDYIDLDSFLDEQLDIAAEDICHYPLDSICDLSNEEIRQLDESEFFAIVQKAHQKCIEEYIEKFEVFRSNKDEYNKIVQKFNDLICV